MELRMFLSVVSQVAGAIMVTAFFIALTSIVVYYCYKWASKTIRHRDKYVRKLKKSKAFEAYNEGKFEIITKKTLKAAKGGRE